MFLLSVLLLYCEKMRFEGHGGAWTRRATFGKRENECGRAKGLSTAAFLFTRTGWCGPGGGLVLPQEATTCTDVELEIAAETAFADEAAGAGTVVLAGRPFSQAILEAIGMGKQRDQLLGAGGVRLELQTQLHDFRIAHLARRGTFLVQFPRRQDLGAGIGGQRFQFPSLGQGFQCGAEFRLDGSTGLRKCALLDQQAEEQAQPEAFEQFFSNRYAGQVNDKSVHGKGIFRVKSGMAVPGRRLAGHDQAMRGLYWQFIGTVTRTAEELFIPPCTGRSNKMLWQRAPSFSKMKNGFSGNSGASGSKLQLPLGPEGTSSW